MITCRMLVANTTENPPSLSPLPAPTPAIILEVRSKLQFLSWEFTASSGQRPRHSLFFVSLLLGYIQALGILKGFIFTQLQMLDAGIPVNTFIDFFFLLLMGGERREMQTFSNPGMSKCLFSPVTSLSLSENTVLFVSFVPNKKIILHRRLYLYS